MNWLTYTISALSLGLSTAAIVTAVRCRRYRTTAEAAARRAEAARDAAREARADDPGRPAPYARGGIVHSNATLLWLNENGCPVFPTTHPHDSRLDQAAPSWIALPKPPEAVTDGHHTPRG